MRIESNKVYFLIIFLFGFMNVFAGSGGSGPPAPTAKQMAPPVGPGLPINENIFTLMIIALLFGIYIIYLNYIKTKNTI